MCVFCLPVFAQQCEEGVAYSKYGTCNGPFDSSIRLQDLTL